MDKLIMTGQLLLSLSILVTLHEMGHFLPAKWFKTRVRKFYLFFDFLFPMQHVLNFAIFKKKIGDTEYGLGWFPFGGYVEIAGMMDESMNTDELKQPPQPWEFRSKPAWQRLIIMLGGIIVNLILGFFIFAGLFRYYGEEYLPTANVKDGIYVDSLGLKLGLQTGDKIIKVGNKPFDKFYDKIVWNEIVINSAKTISVERAGQMVNLPVSDSMMPILTNPKNAELSLFSVPFPFVAGKVQGGQPAAKAGILAEDKIVSFNGIATPYFPDFVRLARAHKNETVTIGVIRGDKPMSFTMVETSSGTIGIAPYPPSKYYTPKRERYTWMQALPAGVAKGWEFLTGQVKAFGKIFSGEIKAKDSLGSVVSMAQMFGKTWIWEEFWAKTAMLSLVLAFMNLLPIPVLDGGQVVFLLWEVFTGRKPSDKFMAVAMNVGLYMVLGLMLYALGLDLVRNLL
jgi:regulator of sigma E protease